jgi:hypothetical protein
VTGRSRRALLRRGAALVAGGGLAALAGCTGQEVGGELRAEGTAYEVTERTAWWAGSFTEGAAVHVLEGRIRTAAGEPVAPPTVEATYFGPDGTELGTARATLYSPEGRPYGTAATPLPDSFEPGSVHRFKLTFRPEEPLARYALRVA